MATSFIQVLAKSADKVSFLYEVFPASQNIASVNLYVSLTDVTANYVKVLSNISNEAALEDGRNVNFYLEVAELRALGGAFTNAAFDVTPLFFRATTVTKAGVESLVSGALGKYIGIVGYNPFPETDNPAQNNHNQLFSNASLNWQRLRGTMKGAVATSSSAMYEDNITIQRTFSGSNLATELIFFTSDPSGAPAKLVTYTGPYTVDGKATTVVYSDATKP
jgi:hypothetical protein